MLDMTKIHKIEKRVFNNMDKLCNYECEMLKDYGDILKPLELKNILGIGMNKVYWLLKRQEIANIRLGKNYIIPKVNLIKYLTKR